MTRPRLPRVSSLEQVRGWASADGAPARLVTEPEQTDVEVTGVTLSTSRVFPGDLYAALPGARAHGADFTAAAVASGAVAVLTDPDGLDRISRGPDGGAGLPLVVADRPRAVLGAVSAGVYGDPAASMRVVGVTGTQGKTTTTRLLEAALQTAGTTAACVGTVGTRVAGRDVPTALTTPEAPDLHGLFAVMREEGVRACAMEVSSHALVLGRVDGVRFNVAVFLNLGRDHLDFHADVEDYYRAKASLFAADRCARAVVDVDGEHGGRLAAELRERGDVPVRTLSTRVDAVADWRVEAVESGPAGSTFVVVGPDGLRLPTAVPIPGAFNVANGLAAVAAAVEAGFDGAAVAAGLAGSTGGVPGRLERVEAGQDFTVVVDYAHKPDAVEAVLATLRPLTRGRLLVVIGAGGDRDPGKRPVMGEIAGRLADLVVVTDDNPRSEDPAAIRSAVLEGARTGRAEVVEVGERRAAIAEALRRAEAGDVVLVAGKGHERGQEVDGLVHPFDDRTVVREVLAG